MDRFDKSRMLENPNAHDFVFPCVQEFGYMNLMNKNAHLYYDSNTVLEYSRQYTMTIFSEVIIYQCEIVQNESVNRIPNHASFVQNLLVRVIISTTRISNFIHVSNSFSLNSYWNFILFQ